MKTMLATLLTVLASASPAWAGYGHDRHDDRGYTSSQPPATVYVDNDAGEEVQVWIDGTFRGAIRPGDVRTFSSLPGHRVVHAETRRGEVLYDTRVQLHPHRTATVQVLPLLLDLVLTNFGDMPLLVDMPGSSAFWLSPGQRRSLDVRAGTFTVSTSMMTYRGLQRVETHRLDVYRDTTFDLGRHVARNTEVTLTNHESRTVRVYIGGREIAVLRRGETRTLEVQPGRHEVLLAEDRGRVLYNAPVSFDANARFHLHFDDRIQVVRLDDGPRRPGHDPGCSCGSCASSSRPVAWVR